MNLNIVHCISGELKKPKVTQIETKSLIGRDYILTTIIILTLYDISWQTAFIYNKEGIKRGVLKPLLFIMR